MSSVEAKLRLTLTRRNQKPCTKFNRCNSPTCYVCQARIGNKRTREIVINLESRILYQVGFGLNLTSNKGESLSQRLETLYAAFKRLRRSKYWKDRVNAGFFQLHVNCPNGTWHPHFHLIIEAKPIDRSLLVKQWQEISGSKDVYLLKVNESEEDNLRLTRYTMKPAFKEIQHNADLMAEYVTATCKRKKYQKFGKFVNTRWNPDNWKTLPKPAPAPKPEPVAPSADEVAEWVKEAEAIKGKKTDLMLSALHTDRSSSHITKRGNDEDCDAKPESEYHDSHEWGSG